MSTIKLEISQEQANSILQVALQLISQSLSAPAKDRTVSDAIAPAARRGRAPRAEGARRRNRTPSAKLAVAEQINGAGPSIQAA